MESKTTLNVLSYLGGLIQIARKEQGIAIQDLAERLDVSIGKAHRLESGSPNITLGLFVEACLILKIPILGGDSKHIKNLSSLLSQMNELIPIRHKQYSEIDDDF